MIHQSSGCDTASLGLSNDIRPFLNTAATEIARSARKARPSMPTSQIEILDWGGPRAPMIIMRDGAALRLDVPKHPASWHAECAAYATQHQSATSGTDQAEHTMHLGFYGYLRLCNALCLEKEGRSIFDVADAPWRNWYDARKPPMAAVTEVFA